LQSGELGHGIDFSHFFAFQLDCVFAYVSVCIFHSFPPTPQYRYSTCTLARFYAFFIVYRSSDPMLIRPTAHPPTSPPFKVTSGLPIRTNEPLLFFLCFLLFSYSGVSAILDSQFRKPLSPAFACEIQFSVFSSPQYGLFDGYPITQPSENEAFMAKRRRFA